MKVQKTLDTFVKNSEKAKKKELFYFYYKDLSVQWRKDSVCPFAVDFSKNIERTFDKTIVLCTFQNKSCMLTSEQCQSDYLYTNKQQQHIYAFQIEKYYTNVSFLKSHLQKSIRRCNIVKSLQIAKHFMQLDLIQFLRRLSIIIMEDVYMIDAIQPLIWLTSGVSKGYKLTHHEVYWLYGLVVYLCKAKFRDTVVYNIHQHTTQPFDINQLEHLSLTDDQKSIFYSLEFRKNYGGLDGDLNMISYYQQTLLTRFLNNTMPTEYYDTIPLFINVNDIQDLKLEDWIINAIDHHVVPQIIELIQEIHDKYSEDEIKSVLWNMSSNINYRIPLCVKYKTVAKPDINIKNLKEYSSIWNKIEKDYNKIAFYYLYKKF